MRSGCVPDALKWNFAEPFVFTKDTAPDECTRMLEAFRSLLGEREAAIAARMAESEKRTLRGSRSSR